MGRRLQRRARRVRRRVLTRAAIAWRGRWVGCRAATRAAFAPRLWWLRRSSGLFSHRLRALVADESAVLAAAGLAKRDDGNGGTGLFATRDLPQGFALRVARPFLLSASGAALSPLGRRLQADAEAQGLAPFAPMELLLACLADARVTPSAPYHAYAASLPWPSPDAGSWPEDRQEALLAGTPLLKELREERGAFAFFALRVARCPSGARLSPDLLRWARGAYRSRGFAADDEEHMMVPLVDLLNHGPTARPAIDGDDAALRITNAAPLAAGDEALNSYGIRGNGDLLKSYGFALEGNRHDTVRVPLRRLGGSGGTALRAGGEIPPKLWACVVGDRDEATRDEASTLAFFLQDLIRREGDPDTTSDADAPDAKAAAAYRRGRRAILTECLGTCLELMMGAS